MDMLEYAGLGVAMGNARNLVKPIADEVTLSNNEECLKHAVEKYSLACL
ncbi:HAD hydrolase family protein [Neobacillus dielmonensis]